MHFVQSPDGKTVSAVGIGCASLGSRISAQEGLACIERAIDAGINWIDVAPSYGDGQAESILGTLPAAKRQALHFTTKVGLQARPSGWKSLIRPVARPLVRLLPGLRKATRRTAGIERVELTPELITASIDASLKRLKVEQLGALMLHSAEPQDLARDEIRAALQAAVSSGKVRNIGIASGLDSISAGRAYPDLFSIFQVANNPFEPNVVGSKHAGIGGFYVTHSALGSFSSLEKLTTLIKLDAGLSQKFETAGYGGTPNDRAVAFLVDYALATNPAGVSIFSAFREGHLDFLLERAANRKAETEVTALAEAVRQVGSTQNVH